MAIPKIQLVYGILTKLNATPIVLKLWLLKSEEMEHRKVTPKYLGRQHLFRIGFTFITIKDTLLSVYSSVQANFKNILYFLYFTTVLRNSQQKFLQFKVA